MWCRNRSQRALLHRKSSLSHAQLDIESYILFASFGLKFGINHNTPKGCLGNPASYLSFFRDCARKKRPLQGSKHADYSYRFQVSGVRFQCLTSPFPCMKLHEIQCHFREIPHAVAEYGLRPRRRPRPL